METIFTKKELLELQRFGKTLLVHPLEERISLELTKTEEMVRALKLLNRLFGSHIFYANTLEVYDYFKKLDFNPASDSLMAWLSMSVANTSFNFLSNEPLPAILVSDNMYFYWNFLNNICFYSKLQLIRYVRCE